MQVSVEKGIQNSLRFMFAVVLTSTTQLQ